MGMTIKDLMPTGSRNAIKRKDLLNACKVHGIADNDREMRRLIEKERQDLCIVCLSDGNGYFIPDNDDKDKLRHYIAQERDRIKSVARNLGVATRLLEDLEYGRV